MLLIIGLGNPGEKYKNNRHNAGFIILDKIQKELNFPEFSFDKKFDSEVSDGTLPLSLRAKRSNLEINGTTLEIAASPDAPRNDKLLLVKPSTFMNNSGEAVQKIMSFYKLTPADIVIIHDDLDIEIGNYKISSDSSAAGHNGVQNIMDKLGTQNFKRVRIGVETAGGRQNRIIPGEDFVLQDFTEVEIKKIASIESAILDELKKL